MIQINSMADLTDFGFHYLTGEADGHCYRGLVSVTARGLKTLQRAMGLANPPALDPPWNVGPKGDPFVGSLLVSPLLAADLAIFALLDGGYAEVYLVERAYLPRESAPLPPAGEGEPPKKRWSMFNLYQGAVLGLKGPADDPEYESAYRDALVKDAAEAGLCLRLFRGRAAVQDRFQHAMTGRVH